MPIYDQVNGRVIQNVDAAREFSDWLSEWRPYTGPLFDVLGYRNGSVVSRTQLSLGESKSDVWDFSNYRGPGYYWESYAQTKRPTKFDLGQAFEDIEFLEIMPLGAFTYRGGSYFPGFAGAFPHNQWSYYSKYSTFGLPYSCPEFYDSSICYVEGQISRIGVAPNRAGSPQVIPLPASFALLGGALIALGAGFRRSGRVSERITPAAP
ncbi:MAG: VPLPA-CTERM sorting domain-containing protein [Rhodobacteraceae bacterium]|nr:VPLPA-CTERM sorting domain-containing protein [Paracoccaceae bacterium]